MPKLKHPKKADLENRLNVLRAGVLGGLYQRQGL